MPSGSKDPALARNAPQMRTFFSKAAACLGLRICLAVEAVSREPVSKTDSLLTANLTGNFRPFASYEGSERPSSLAMSLPYVEKRQNQIRVFERQQQRPSISGTGPCD